MFVLRCSGAALFFSVITLSRQGRHFVFKSGETSRLRRKTFFLTIFKICNFMRRNRELGERSDEIIKAREKGAYRHINRARLWGHVRIYRSGGIVFSLRHFLSDNNLFLLYLHCIVCFFWGTKRAIGSGGDIYTRVYMRPKKQDSFGFTDQRLSIPRWPM